MAIKDDFENYIDGNSLNTPAPCVPIPNQKGSDNGPSFTSEYYIILKKNGQLTEQDKLDYAQKIAQCVDSNGLLNRVPVGQNDGLESVDDYFAVSNGCIELGNAHIPRQFLKAILKYKGSLDNLSPGTWCWQSFLIRQPQLLACIVNASFPSIKNPLHWLVRKLFFPFYAYSAIIVATGNMWDDVSDSNSRRLAWHVQNNLKNLSLLCYLASLIWLWRLKKEYPNEMADVAGIYYSSQGLNQNPYSKWWVT